MKYERAVEILEDKSLNNEEKITFNELDIHILSVSRKLKAIHGITFPGSNIEAIVAHAIEILIDLERGEKYLSEMYYYLTNVELPEQNTIKLLPMVIRSKDSFYDQLVKFDILMKAVLDFVVEWMLRIFGDVEICCQYYLVRTLIRGNSIFVILAPDEEIAEKEKGRKWVFTGNGYLENKLIEKEN